MKAALLCLALIFSSTHFARPAGGSVVIPPTYMAAIKFHAFRLPSAHCSRQDTE
jgi:hypothetical protein